MNDELQFLPAALEIQETPPLKAGRYILWAIILFFTVAVAWATVGQVDIVGVATGKIVPSSRVKVIQPLETGTVREIFVKEGDYVKTGQPLVELDTTLTGADRDQIKKQRLATRLDKLRLEALIDEIHRDKVNEASPKPLAPGPFPSEATPSQVRITTSRYHTQLNQFNASQQALIDEKQQHTAERAAVTQRIEQLDATIPLITERVESLRELLDKKLVPRVQYLELEQQRIEQVKERDVQVNNLAGIDATIANITQRLAAQKAEFESQLLTDLADAENKIAGFDQELVKAEKRVTLQTLKSPVSGTIQQLTIHTIGGVVTPAQELMHIVPGKDAVEVEAWIQNRDIGFVQAGQDAKIKVETFPFTKYGTINARLLTVSNDATPNDKLGLVYEARVKMEKTTMNVEDKVVNLSPGMAVTVEVKMGKRRLIEYLMSPLLKYKDESVRER